MTKKIVDHIQILNYSPDSMDSPNEHDPTNKVPAENNSPPLEGGYSTKIGGMWTPKHYISSQKIYELLTKT